MGLRGPKPTPKPILEGRGSWRATEGGDGMKAKAEIPPCPKGLGPIARREWRRQSKILLDLGVISSLDRAALAVWCDTWEEFLSAVGHLRKNGKTVKGSMGQVVQSPWLKTKAAAADRLLKYAAQFGFTPSARARINSVEPGEDDAFGDFVAGKVG
jgi:P27 family predicted phage terminase small subunit